MILLPSRTLLLLCAVLLVTARLTVLVHELEHDPLTGEEACEQCLLGQGTGQVLGDASQSPVALGVLSDAVTELPGHRPGFSPLVRPPRSPPAIPKSVWI